MDLTGEIINGRYRIGELMACGATGEVYEAVQETLGRKVAVKVMRMDIPMESYSLAMERFRHEAKVTALLKHPNIVTVFDYGCTFNGRLFIVMEWVGGKSLRQLIKGKPLGLGRTIPLFRQILMGLESAHEAGLIHRDLKPDNIKVSVDKAGRESVKVLDFGLSVQRTLPLPSPGTWVVGSPGYMSPEQAGGQSVDVRSDLYAMGLMLYEAVTGRKAYSARTIEDWLHAHQSSARPNMRGIAPGVKRILSKALAKDPDQRFQTAKEMRLALESIDVQRPVPRVRMRRLRRLLTTVVVSYTILLLTLLFNTGI